MKDIHISSHKQDIIFLYVLIVILVMAVYYAYRDLHPPLQSTSQEATAPVTEAKKEAPKPNSLTESSPEYITAVLERSSDVTEDPDIDSIKLDGSILYINFIKPQTLNEYRAVAEMNAWQFSEFELQKLGVSQVSVFITYKDKLVCSIDAAEGKVIPASLRYIN